MKMFMSGPEQSITNAGSIFQDSDKLFAKRVNSIKYVDSDLISEMQVSSSSITWVGKEMLCIGQIWNRDRPLL